VKKIILITLSILVASPTHAVCPDGKSYPVTLTFDDGPHSVLTPKVLDVLKEEQVKATFFVLGEHFAGGRANPATKSAYALVERQKKEGHYVGSHTYSHFAHSKLSAEKMKENIIKSGPLLKDILSPILRLPYGDGSFRSSNPTIQAKNNLVMSTVKGAGYKHVGWDVDTNDWDVRKRSILVSSMLKQICATKGGVILFHDIQKNTVEHLKEWIGIIKKEGHTFVGMEHFVPEVLNPLPPEACGEISVPKPVKDLDTNVNEVLKKMDPQE
jgi:peptidoglycan/xylan/chitin deacetylase (PgdA/CDA1 family)